MKASGEVWKIRGPSGVGRKPDDEDASVRGVGPGEGVGAGTCGSSSGIVSRVDVLLGTEGGEPLDLGGLSRRSHSTDGCDASSKIRESILEEISI